MKIFNNQVYDILKYIAMIALPALAVFIEGLFSIWGIPYGNEISKTIMLLNALLGALLGVSTIGYNKSNKQ